MLQVRNISKWFGDVNVLNQISFYLNRGQRAGLVGPNGSGKSTLLRIIAGEMQPDQGRVQLVPASLRLGYLPQALELPPAATVADVLTAAQGERVSLETRLEQLAERIAARPRISAYLASDRRQPFSEDGIFRHYPELDP